MAKILKIKRGDTFFVTATYTDAANTPIALDDVTIKSEVRNLRGELISSLLITKQDQFTSPGLYTLKSATDAWPIGDLQWDIQYLQNGQIQSTDTITITVEKDITV